MKTRNADWFNTHALTPLYGIEIRVDGRWIRAGDDNGPYLFVTEKERDIKRAELRKQHSPVTLEE